jgi:hypothetical protein
VNREALLQTLDLELKMPNTESESKSERRKREVASRALVVIIGGTRQRLSHHGRFVKAIPKRRKGSTWWAAKGTWAYR